MTDATEGKRRPGGRSWPPYEDRFWSKVDKSGECWTWLASTNQAGYGRFRSERHDGRMVVAHRVAYELTGRVIADGLSLDHLCRNRSCVRPDHLEPVTHTENVRRGLRGCLHEPIKVCVAGLHAMTGENLFISHGKRSCRTCRNARRRERRANSKHLAR